jgi:hypothetical protein
MKCYELPFSGPVLLHACRQLAGEDTSMLVPQVFERARIRNILLILVTMESSSVLTPRIFGQLAVQRKAIFVYENCCCAGYGNADVSINCSFFKTKSLS